MTAVHEFVAVPVAKIQTPVQIRPVDRGWVDRLAASINTRGLDTPIIVHDAGDGTFRLGPGRHRLEAFIKLRRDTIPAIVKEPATDEQLLAEQVRENFEREDLSPLQQADLCASVLERVAGDEAQAAAIMGRPVRWVQNRAALASLAPKVRALVESNDLPIAHAQAIARVPSAEKQVDLAKRAAISTRDWGDGRPMALKDLLNLVEAEGRDLVNVNWKLDAVFGKHGACSACPFNSANRGDLFAEGAEPKKPTCLERECYTEKTALASRGAQKAANFLAKEGLKVTPTTSAQAVLAREVPFVRPSVVKDYVRAKAKTKGKGDANDPDAGKPKGPTAEQILDRSVHEWDTDVERALGKALKGKPLALTLISLVERIPGCSQYGRGARKDLAIGKTLLAGLAKVDAAVLLEAAKLQDARYPSIYLHPDLVVLACEKLNVKVPAKPTIEGVKAILAKAEAAEKKPTAKAPAKKARK